MATSLATRFMPALHCAAAVSPKGNEGGCGLTPILAFRAAAWMS